MDNGFHSGFVLKSEHLFILVRAFSDSFVSDNWIWSLLFDIVELRTHLLIHLDFYKYFYWPLIIAAWLLWPKVSWIMPFTVWTGSSAIFRCSFWSLMTIYNDARIYCEIGSGARLTLIGAWHIPSNIFREIFFPLNISEPFVILYSCSSPHHPWIF